MNRQKRQKPRGKLLGKPRGKTRNDIVPRWARPGVTNELKMEGHLMGGEFPDLDELKAIHDVLYTDDGYGSGGWGSDDDDDDDDDDDEGFNDFGSGFLDGIGPKRQFRRPPWERGPQDMSSTEFEQLKRDIIEKDVRCNMEVPSLKEINSNLLDRVKEELTGEEFLRLNKTTVYNAAKEHLKGFKKVTRRDFVVRVGHWTEDLGLMRDDKQSDGEVAHFLLLKVYGEMLTTDEFIYLDMLHVDDIVHKARESIEVPDLYSMLFTAMCDVNVLRAKSIAKENVRPDFDAELHIGSAHRIPIDEIAEKPIRFCKGPCCICNPSAAARQESKGKADAQGRAGPVKKPELNASAPGFTPTSVARALREM